MRFLRSIFALTLVAAFLLAIGIAPNTALAVTATVEGETCTPRGLELGILDAGEDGLVTFNCTEPQIDFASWEDQITISIPITIDGTNGGEQIVLDGNDATNFFVIESGGNVTIRNMTFQNGNTHNSDEYDGAVRVFESTNEGGAIDIEDEGSLTVISTSFFDNYAVGYGGAIDCNSTDASLTIRGSAFVGNESGLDGGAIESWCSLVISQSSFINNIADTNEGAGGAIDAYSGTVEINSSTFSGNQAFEGSAIKVDDRDDDQISAMISWSTMFQSTGTAPAVYFDSPVTLTGVILGGDGEHCEFDGFNGTLTGNYNLTNDESCDPDNEVWEGQNLLLGQLTSITINDVVQQYYPLIEGSPAIDGGPASCDTATQPGADADQIGTPRPNGNGFCDVGAWESNPIIIVVSTSLCANEWTGQLRMIDEGDDCGRSEMYIELPQDAPLMLCVNRWNGSTSLGNYCGRNEYQLTVFGDGSIDVCVNRWNGSLRVSDFCSRTEEAQQI